MISCCLLLPLLASTPFIEPPPEARRVEVLAHYRPGEQGGISFAAGPDTLDCRSGVGPELKMAGGPVFFADAPGKARARGEGCLRFDGEDDRYGAEQAVGNAGDDFVLEAWARALSSDDPGLHGVVSNGDGAVGYTIAQQGPRWVAFVGGVGAFEMGNVARDTWVHLALVAEGSDCSLHVDGRRVGSFQRAARLAPRFTIGDMGHGKETFHGDVYEVRLCRIAGGPFDPEALLLDREAARVARERDEQRQRSLVEGLTRRRPGVRVIQKEIEEQPAGVDWLVQRVVRPVELLVRPAEDGKSAKLVLTNGLISRTFHLGEGFACYGYRNLSSGAEFIRAIKPEARLQLDGRWYDVGGLKGQIEKAYTYESWLPDLYPDPGAFVLTGIDVGEPIARYPWQPKFNAVPAPWPPRGLRVDCHYRAPANAAADHAEVRVTVHYEMYEGLPVVAKSLTVKNGGTETVVVEKTWCEVLAVTQDQVDRLHSESDYSFALAYAHPEGSALLHFTGTFKDYIGFGGTTAWEVDPEYTSWATANPTEDTFLGFQHRNLMTSRLPIGPAEHLEPGAEHRSFTTFELLQDSDDRERRALAHRRMYRVLAPQVTESLLGAATSSRDEALLKSLIDQMAELGFELLLLHPPGVSHDNLDPDYVTFWKGIADYAKERGIVMGGSSVVIGARGRGAAHDCIRPDTGKPGTVFGQSLCLATEFGADYLRKTLEFLDRTGFMSWAADGPYHGDVCASGEHAHHAGIADSRFQQWRMQTEMLHELQRRNTFVSIPEWYFLNGQVSTGMGYREAAANLSPQQQLLLNRQYIYDGTWHKIPTMGWIGVQLVGFYTSDPSVGLEPLVEHLALYERNLVQCLGAGAMTVVRGNRLYDTSETKSMVEKWARWFRKYRPILTSDLIHITRPTGRGLDAMLHVNPELETRGLAVVFNPTQRRIERELKVPLYYAGLTESVGVREREGPLHRRELDSRGTLQLPVTLEPGAFTWFVFER